MDDPLDFSIVAFIGLMMDVKPKLSGNYLFNFMRRTSLQNANILNLWRHCRLPERKDDLNDKL